MNLTATQRKILEAASAGPMTVHGEQQMRIAENMMFRQWISIDTPTLKAMSSVVTITSQGRRLLEKARAAESQYRYCILPGGNSPEFPDLDAELNDRGIKASVSALKNGGRLYRIPKVDVSKLPSDEKGHYLGDEDSGHTISLLSDAAMELFREELGGLDWTFLEKENAK
jgi:hypothetical protein